VELHKWVCVPGTVSRSLVFEPCLCKPTVRLLELFLSQRASLLLGCQIQAF
jgi:hypothetical protein